MGCCGSDPKNIKEVTIRASDVVAEGDFMIIAPTNGPEDDNPVYVEKNAKGDTILTRIYARIFKGKIS